ncbi:MAG: hypothetical protein R2726_00105 [Acidimicrobiales bacterium]
MSAAGEATPWPVVRRAGTAADLHALDLPDRPGGHVWALEVTGSALVLGSAQPDSDVDRAVARRRRVAVVRRRSGGGAVLLVPGEVIWCDLAVPRDGAGFTDDVGRQFRDAGDRWLTALRGLTDLPVASVTTADARPSVLGRVVCFAGRGPGEVCTGAEAKLVGLSQRRTRAGARVQGLVHRRFDARATAELLAPGLRRIGVDPDAAVAALATTVAVVDLEAGAVAEALGAAGPSPRAEPPPAPAGGAT